MKIKMLMDSRVSFPKGSVIEIEEGEATRLLSLGFAEKVEEKKAVEVKKIEEVEKVVPKRTAKRK